MLLQDRKPDVMALIDTAISSDPIKHNFLGDEVLAVDGYNIIRKDNHSEKKGGILIYVKNELVVEEDKHMNKISADFKECKWITIKANNEDLLFGVFYRKGSSSVANEVILRDIISQGSRRSHKILICGDFNYPMINWKSGTVDGGPYSKQMRFYDMLMDNFLIQNQEEFSRVRGKDKPSCLDLVITDDNQTQVKTNIKLHAPIALSDHDVVTWQYLLSVEDHKGEETTDNRKHRNYNKGNYEEISNTLGKEDWESLLNNKDVEEQVQILYEKIKVPSDKYIPLSSGKKKSNVPPWMTKKARKQVRKKQCAWKRYTSSRSYQKYLLYVKERNKSAREIKDAKKEYEKRLSDECKRNPKVLFQYANFKSKSRHNYIRLKDCNGKFITDDETNAHVLNEFFSSVFTYEDDAPEIILNQAANWLWGEDISDPFEKDTQFQQFTPIEDLDIDICEIEELLKEIDPYKSTSPDCVHPRILKECATALSVPIKIIFETSMKTGSVPQIWRDGTVTPLFKSGDRHDVANYRPITLTSLLCRILEKIIKKHLVKHLLGQEILSDDQHGFLPQRSCLSNLLETLNDITEMVDNGNCVDEVFLDFQKAFDKVPHQRLLYKAEKLGLSGNVLNWISAFLSNRRQRVSVRGKYSKWKNVLSGVPQGSVLGPILFLIYINDIGYNLSSNIKLFADDSKVYHIVNEQYEAEQLQKELDKLYEWTQVWKMSFNRKKCHVLQFGAKNQKYIYHLNGYLLESVTEEKDLGIVISEDLKLKKNVSEAVKKANKMVGLIRNTFSYLDRNMFVKLYTAYIRPLLEYCQQICHPYLQSDIDTVEKVQRRATKMLYSIRDLTYEERLKYLNLYSLEDRRTRGDMILTYQILNRNIKTDPNNLFQLSKNTHLRGHCFKLATPPCKLDIRRNFFNIRIVSPWNKLPSDIVNSRSVEEFKRRYDNYHGYHNQN